MHHLPHQHPSAHQNALPPSNHIHHDPSPIQPLGPQAHDHSLHAPNDQLHLSYDQIRSANVLNSSSIDHPSSPAPLSPLPSSQNKPQPDLDSEAAFPSLGSPAPPPKTVVGWGARPALGSRVLGSHQKSSPAAPSQFTETLVLLLSSIHIGPVPPQFREKGPRQAGEKREEDPKTLPDVLRAIQRRHPTVSVESSTSRDRVTILFRTPFVLPPPTSSMPAPVRTAHGLNPEERIVRARQELLSRVTRKVERVIRIPAAVKQLVIGQRGKVLKEIIELTGASVSLPPKDEAPPAGPDSACKPDGAEDVEMIPITIVGEESAVLDAEERILQIVREHTNKITHRITSIPPTLYALLDGPASRRPPLAELGSRMLVDQLGIKPENVNCQVLVPSINQVIACAPSHICLTDLERKNGSNDYSRADTEPNQKSLPIVVSGDREQVEFVVKLIESTYEKMLKATTKVEVELPKRQHRFLDGPAIEEILAATGSLAILPAPMDPSEKVVIRGEKMSNVQALGLVVTKANAFEVETIDLKSIHPRLADPQAYATQLVAYLSSRAPPPKLQTIGADLGKQSIQLFFPLPGVPTPTVEIVGTASESVAQARKLVAGYLQRTFPAGCFESVEVEMMWLKHVVGRKNARLAGLLDKHTVELVAPPPSGGLAMVVLVATKAIGGGDGKAVAAETSQTLKIVKEEILRVVGELAAQETVELSIPQKLHGLIRGPKDSGLKTLVGEEGLVNVEFGKPGASDVVLIRGTKSEVGRAEKELRRLAEEAALASVMNSFTTEFEVESKIVSHLVGKGGASVSKLAEELSVKVDFSAAPLSQPLGDVDGSHGANGAGGGGGARKHHSSSNKKAKTVVSIIGKKENVEEAKRRILGQAERLVDEVTVSIPILAGLDKGALIGKGGKYILRLQETHLVHINMPRGGGAGGGGEAGVNGGSDSDSITVRGPRKGVDAVRRELVELMDYEREHGHTVTMTISTKSVARIVGKGGAHVEKIREETGVEGLDIDPVEGGSGEMSRVTLRGTKAAVGAAKRMVGAVAAEVEDEGTAEVRIARAHHQALIGRGGSRLRELVRAAGGDEDAARLVHFPKSHETGEGAELVRIKGRKGLVGKIKEALEAEASRLASQVVYGVQVPKASQAGLIGRGASGLKVVQSAHGVVVVVPGWKEWAGTDEVVNPEEVMGIEDEELFKVVGSKEGCLGAIEEIKSKIVATGKRIERVKVVRKSIEVPYKYHLVLSENGRFNRGLPKGIRIEYGNLQIEFPSERGGQDSNGGNGKGGKKSSASGKPAAGGRIDVAEDDQQQQGSVVLEWKVEEIKVPKEGSVVWTIIGPTEEEILPIEASITSRLESLRSCPDSELPSHVGTGKVEGWAVPRIVGRGGSGLRMLREESGAIGVDVVGRQGSDTVRVVGSVGQVESVRKLIDKIVR